MLDFLLRNEDSIIIGVFFMLIGFPVGVLFSRLLGKHEATPAPSVRIGAVIEVPVPLPGYTRRQIRSSANDSDSMALGYIVIAVLCFGFVYWHEQVLLAAVSFVCFSVGLFFGTTLYAYKIDAIDGSGWTLYLLFTCGIGVLSFVLIDSATRPTYAPQAFESYQEVLRTSRLGAFLQWAGLRNLTWLVTHVAGVFILFYVQVRLVLSLVHYLAMLRLATSTSGPIVRWFAVSTRKYKNPIKNCFTLTSLGIVSFLLINGYAFVWYEQLLQTTRTL
ncbi:hypothetical protein [Burkholderia sp. RS02]|uniref:hypothetical protein n=1 Tax=unclassified Burkholderia TaxID=2613784 RepID=UPI003218AACC